jgi:C1A family cysteine protease
MKTIPSKIGRSYGYFPGLKNPHAKNFCLTRPAQLELPPSFDNTQNCPPVYDQGQTSSCTANAIAAAYQFMRMVLGEPPLTPSRLFIYWNERVMEGDSNQDNGAFGGDGLTSLENLGVCDESLWPFDPAAITTAPSAAAFEAALANKIMEKQVLTSISGIKTAVVESHLVTFGITLYESFESDTVAYSGVVPDPTPSENQLGGHEMAIVGYDDARQAFKVRNSWGPSWGLSGYCWISYNYMMSAAQDFEVITQI